MIRERVIPSIRFGRRVVVPRSRLQALIDGERGDAVPARPAASESRHRRDAGYGAAGGRSSSSNREIRCGGVRSTGGSPALPFVGGRQRGVRSTSGGHNLLFGAHTELAIAAAPLAGEFGIDPVLMASTRTATCTPSSPKGHEHSIRSEAADLLRRGSFSNSKHCTPTCGGAD